MGEFLLVCSIVTLILMVFFIDKKKKEDRAYKQYLERINRKDRYDRDDSIYKDKSPVYGGSEMNNRYRNRGDYSPSEYINSMSKYHRKSELNFTLINKS